ncbi:hypothetical protein GCM10022222_67680 [Amycolatopsis ultiminotia]|uniref:Uncharacterized protein n=1 Tax=Amycolatopsis ultiminotia TaxID=543629 RepID=A0ABP6XZA0_9PSEU
MAREADAEVTLVSGLDTPLSDVPGPELGSLPIELHRAHEMPVSTGSVPGSWSGQYHRKVQIHGLPRGPTRSR